jgi:phosphoserine aminotransferase
LFINHIEKTDRSKMNVCFVMNDDSLEKPFLDFATANSIIGIKGHRLSGGFRASLYNAMPLSSVQHLVEVMRAFAKMQG